MSPQGGSFFKLEQNNISRLVVGTLDSFISQRGKTNKRYNVCFKNTKCWQSWYLWWFMQMEMNCLIKYPQQQRLDSGMRLSHAWNRFDFWQNWYELFETVSTKLIWVVQPTGSSQKSLEGIFPILSSIPSIDRGVHAFSNRLSSYIWVDIGQYAAIIEYAVHKKCNRFCI